MANRTIPIVQGEFYHIYNRGNNRQQIFFDEEDYGRFIKLLYLCNSNNRVNFKEDIIKKKIDAWEFDRGMPIVSIGAWVLMPNHFHIYITQPKGYLWAKKGNAISTFMEKLGTAYSKYLNKKYDRTGGVFEGTFRSKHITNEAQAQYLFAYIHLNPIKLVQSDWKEKGVQDTKGAFEFLDSYAWSSYQDFLLRERPENAILDRGNFVSYFENQQEFKKDMLSWFILE